MGFQPSKVGQDFFHLQYHGYIMVIHYGEELLAILWYMIYFWEWNKTIWKYYTSQMGIQHPSFHQQEEGYNCRNSNKIGVEQSKKEV